MKSRKVRNTHPWRIVRGYLPTPCSDWGHGMDPVYPAEVSPHPWQRWQLLLPLRRRWSQIWSHGSRRGCWGLAAWWAFGEPVGQQRSAADCLASRLEGYWEQWPRGSRGWHQLDRDKIKSIISVRNVYLFYLSRTIFTNMVTNQGQLRDSAHGIGLGSGSHV